MASASVPTIRIASADPPFPAHAGEQAAGDRSLDRPGRSGRGAGRDTTQRRDRTLNWPTKATPTMTPMLTSDGVEDAPQLLGRPLDGPGLVQLVGAERDDPDRERADRPARGGCAARRARLAAHQRLPDERQDQPDGDGEGVGGDQPLLQRPCRRAVGVGSVDGGSRGRGGRPRPIRSRLGIVRRQSLPARSSPLCPPSACPLRCPSVLPRSAALRQAQLRSVRARESTPAVRSHDTVRPVAVTRRYQSSESPDIGSRARHGGQPSGRMIRWRSTPSYVWDNGRAVAQRPLVAAPRRPRRHPGPPAWPPGGHQPRTHGHRRPGPARVDDRHARAGRRRGRAARDRRAARSSTSAARSWPPSSSTSAPTATSVRTR